MITQFLLNFTTIFKETIQEQKKDDKFCPKQFVLILHTDVIWKYDTLPTILVIIAWWQIILQKDNL